MILTLLAGAAGLGAGFFVGFFIQAVQVARLKERHLHYESLLERDRLQMARLQDEFKLAASEALQNANEQFLSSAIKDLRQAKSDADNTLDLKSQTIDHSLRQLMDGIKDYQGRVEKIEKDRGVFDQKLEGALRSVLEAEEAVRGEAAGLKRALLTSPGVRGRLGERALLQILEKSDFVRGIDFDTQVPMEGGIESDLRPDIVIQLPGGKRLAVDSKDVTGEYALAQDTEDPARQREHHLKLVQNIRNNFTRLARKEYQAFLDSDLPYVIMFIPSEAAIRAAFATEPALFDEACAKKVIMASPMTIIPLIQLVKVSWQQYQLAGNARELGGVVEALGERLSKFVAHLKNIREGIQKSADAWNEAVGSWDKRVVPQMERVKSLGGRLKESESLTPVESHLRSIEERSPEEKWTV